MQQDAIIIYHREEVLASCASLIPSTQTENNMTIEFSNSKSQELFGVDLQSAANSLNALDFDHAHEKLTLPQFIQLKNSDEQSMNNEAKRYNAMRALLESDADSQYGMNVSLELISLKDIILDKYPNDSQSFIKMPVDGEADSTHQ